jgi:hypothetical protein
MITEIEAIVEVMPMASGPTHFAVANQKRNVKIEGIIVLKEVNQMFLPKFVESVVILDN